MRSLRQKRSNSLLRQCRGAMLHRSADVVLLAGRLESSPSVSKSTLTSAIAAVRKHHASVTGSSLDADLADADQSPPICRFR